MVYRKFQTGVSLRVLFVVLSVATLFYLLFHTRLYSAVILLTLLLVYQTHELVHYVARTNRNLARFFDSVKYGDFTLGFKEKIDDSSFAELNEALSEVTGAFQKARAEKEEHFRYLQTVVQHIGIGLVAFRPDGRVELINAAAKRLLKTSRLKNVRSLESWSPELVGKLLRLRPRERALVKIEDENELLHLALYATKFRLRGESYTLVSIQNIHSELEEKEMEAWQKLIRVLTHEIMNSVTPIASLASTINDLITEHYSSPSQASTENQDALDDIHLALQTIQKRSQGMLQFVEAYRSLTNVKKPNFEIFPVKGLFGRVAKLMQANPAAGPVAFRVHIDPDGLELTADPSLIEQVLINLLLNAIQSLEGRPQPCIEILARLDDLGRPLIQVKDNGPGISGENLENIFIPFFSTKEAGSGIGLSLSRQIMRLHQGTITVHSDPGIETTFTLRF
jgi:two-component system nitrogen regulation sensor histidine kinase NtrY